MTDANNVFQDGTNQEQSGAPDTTAEVPGSTSSVFETLVGEGRKYSDPEALAKSRIHADEHIKRIEEENAKLKEENAKARAREELLAELKQQQGADQAPAHTDTPGESITADQIDKRIREALMETDATKRAQENIEAASAAIYSVYGEKSSEFIAKKAAELGVSTDFLMQTAAQSPKAALSVLGVSETQAPARESSVTPSSIKPTGEAGSFSRFQELDNMRKSKNGKGFYGHEKLELEWLELKKQHRKS